MESSKMTIADILNEYTVIIRLNGHVLNLGQQLEIVEEGHEIKDRSTGEVLGILDKTKGLVKVEKVDDNYAIATSDDYEEVSMFAPDMFTKTRRKRLPVDPSEVSGGSWRSQEPIKVGDVVKKLK